MPSKWLLKSDPDHYSFSDLLRERKTVWDGISNNLALKHLRAVRRGDLAFIYHTGSERAIVGIAKVLSDPYPDPRQKNARLVVVDIAAKEELPQPVSLEQIKQERTPKDFDLVRLPRLSVVPVTDSQWSMILKLARS